MGARRANKGIRIKSINMEKRGRENINIATEQNYKKRNVIKKIINLIICSLVFAFQFICFKKNFRKSNPKKIIFVG